MAASNIPKNDFAPSWLKIPSQGDDNKKSTGLKASHAQEGSNQQHNENYYSHFMGGEYPPSLSHHHYSMFDTRKCYSANDMSKFQQPGEDDYYFHYGYGYPYHFPYSDHYSMQFRSHPSVPHQDLSYPPSPFAKFGQMNGSYEGYGYYFDFFPSGEGFSSYDAGGWDGSQQRRGSGHSSQGGDQDKSSADYSSVNGNENEGDVKVGRNTSIGGLWEIPPRSNSFDVGDLKHAQPRGAPNKGASWTRGSCDGMQRNGVIGELSPVPSDKAAPDREGVRSSPSQPMEILSTRMAQPKPSIKKSQCLKPLHREARSEGGAGSSCSNCHRLDSTSSLEPGDKEAEVVMNGFGELQLDCDSQHCAGGCSSILSSSMEKEISFLRSLGWNPNELEETEEITEDEKREFQKLTDKLQQQQAGRPRMLPKSWSPQHVSSVSHPIPALDGDETLSSSDTDSD